MPTPWILQKLGLESELHQNRLSWKHCYHYTRCTSGRCPLSVLTLIGENPSHHELGTTYTDPGLTVTDSNGDPIENPDFTINGTDALVRVGSYALTYTYTDPDGHEAIPISRQVNVSDTTAPIVTLTGEPTVTLFPRSTL